MKLACINNAVAESNKSENLLKSFSKLLSFNTSIAQANNMSYSNSRAFLKSENDRRESETLVPDNQTPVQPTAWRTDSKTLLSTVVQHRNSIPYWYFGKRGQMQFESCLCCRQHNDLLTYCIKLVVNIPEISFVKSTGQKTNVDICNVVSVALKTKPNPFSMTDTVTVIMREEF